MRHYSQKPTNFLSCKRVRAKFYKLSLALTLFRVIAQEAHSPISVYLMCNLPLLHTSSLCYSNYMEVELLKQPVTVDIRLDSHVGLELESHEKN